MLDSKEYDDDTSASSSMPNIVLTPTPKRKQSLVNIVADADVAAAVAAISTDSGNYSSSSNLSDAGDNNIVQKNVLREKEQALFLALQDLRKLRSELERLSKSEQWYKQELRKQKTTRLEALERLYAQERKYMSENQRLQRECLRLYGKCDELEETLKQQTTKSLEELSNESIMHIKNDNSIDATINFQYDNQKALINDQQQLIVVLRKQKLSLLDDLKCLTEEKDAKILELQTLLANIEIENNRMTKKCRKLLEERNNFHESIKTQQILTQNERIEKEKYEIALFQLQTQFLQQEQILIQKENEIVEMQQEFRKNIQNEGNIDEIHRLSLNYHKEINIKNYEILTLKKSLAKLQAEVEAIDALKAEKEEQERLVEQLNSSLEARCLELQELKSTDVERSQQIRELQINLETLQKERCEMLSKQKSTQNALEKVEYELIQLNTQYAQACSASERVKFDLEMHEIEQGKMEFKASRDSEDIMILRTKLNVYLNETSSLSKRIMQLEIVLKEYKTEKQQMIDNLKDMEMKLKNEYERYSRMEILLEENDRDMNELQEKLKENHIKLEKSFQENNLLKLENLNVIEKLKLLQENYNLNNQIFCEDKNLPNMTIIDELRMAMKIQVDDNKLLNGKLLEKLQESVSLDKEVNEKEVELKKIRLKLLKNDGKLYKLEKEKIANNDNMIELNLQLKNFDKLKETNIMLHEKLQLIQKDKEKLQENLNIINIEKEELQENLFTAQNNITKLQENLHAITVEKEKLQENLSAVKSIITTLQENLKSNSNENQKLQENLQNHNIEKQELQEHLTIAQNNIIKLEEHLKLHHSENDKLQENLQTHTVEKQKLQENLNVAQNHITKLQENLQSHHNEKQKLQENLQTHTVEKQELQENLNVAQNNISKLQENLQIINNEKQKLQETVTIAQNTVITLQENLKANNIEKQKLQENYIVAQNNISLLQENLQATHIEKQKMQENYNVSRNGIIKLPENLHKINNNKEKLRETCIAAQNNIELQENAQLNNVAIEKLQENVQIDFIEIQNMQENDILQYNNTKVGQNVLANDIEVQKQQENVHENDIVQTVNNTLQENYNVQNNNIKLQEIVETNDIEKQNPQQNSNIKLQENLKEYENLKILALQSIEINEKKDEEINALNNKLFDLNQLLENDEQLLEYIKNKKKLYQLLWADFTARKIAIEVIEYNENNQEIPPLNDIEMKTTSTVELESKQTEIVDKKDLNFNPLTNSHDNIEQVTARKLSKLTEGESKDDMIELISTENLSTSSQTENSIYHNVETSTDYIEEETARKLSKSIQTENESENTKESISTKKLHMSTQTENRMCHNVESNTDEMDTRSMEKFSIYTQTEDIDAETTNIDQFNEFENCLSSTKVNSNELEQNFKVEKSPRIDSSRKTDINYINEKNEELIQTLKRQLNDTEKQKEQLFVQLIQQQIDKIEQTKQTQIEWEELLSTLNESLGAQQMQDQELILKREELEELNQLFDEQNQELLDLHEINLRSELKYCEEIAELKETFQERYQKLQNNYDEKLKDYDEQNDLLIELGNVNEKLQKQLELNYYHKHQNDENCVNDLTNSIEDDSSKIIQHRFVEKRHRMKVRIRSLLKNIKILKRALKLAENRASIAIDQLQDIRLTKRHMEELRFKYEQSQNKIQSLEKVLADERKKFAASDFGKLMPVEEPAHQVANLIDDYKKLIQQSALATSRPKTSYILDLIERSNQCVPNLQKLETTVSDLRNDIQQLLANENFMYNTEISTAKVPSLMDELLAATEGI